MSSSFLADRYRILRELGRGAGGIVYEVDDTTLGRIVALKLLKSGEAEDVERFEREAHASARLRHPNIVAIHDIGRDEEYRFFTMDRIEGGTLQPSSLPPRRGLEIIRDIARAVHHAHEHGIVHRDIKPTNILLSTEGVPYVTDFGLAREMDSPSQYTVSGTLLGTPNYMSPEQARGEIRSVGRRSDVYSLCAVLYECVVHAPPHHGETLIELLSRVAHEEVLPPSRRGVRVSRDIETILMKGLDLDPERRYGSAAELADDIDRYLRDEPILARPVSSLHRGFRWVRRRPLVASLPLLIAAVLVLLGYSLYSRQRADTALGVEKRREAAAPFLESSRLALDRAYSSLRTPGIPLSSLSREAKTAWTDAENAIQQAPDSAEAHLQAADAAALLFRVFEGTEWQERANASYQKSLTLAPDSVAARLGRAELLLWRQLTLVPPRCTFEGNFKVVLSPGSPSNESEQLRKETTRLLAEAIALLNRAPAGERAYAQTFLEMAQGNYEACIRSATDALQETCKRMDLVYWWRGYSHQGLNRPREAAADFRSARSLLPSFPPILESLTFALLSSGQWDEAVQTADDFRRLRPDDPAPHFLCGVTLYARAKEARRDTDFPTAEEMFTKAIDLLEGSRGTRGALSATLVREYRGELRRDRGDIAGAEADFRAALEQDPESVTTLGHLAALDLDRNKPAEAREWIDRALALSPGDAQLLFFRAESKRFCGDPRGSLEDYDKSLSLDSRDPLVYFGRAHAHKAFRDFDSAEADLSRALELRPAFSEARANRGELRAQRGDLDGAIEDWDQAIGEGVRSPKLHSLRAHARLQLLDRRNPGGSASEEELGEIESDLEAALELDPRNAMACWGWAQIYVRRAKYPEAAEALRKAMDFNPALREQLTPSLRDIERWIREDRREEE